MAMLAGKYGSKEPCCNTARRQPRRHCGSSNWSRLRGSWPEVRLLKRSGRLRGTLCVLCRLTMIVRLSCLMVLPSSVTAQTAVILSEVAQQPTLTIDILATTCYAYPLCFSTVDVCSTSVGAGEAVIPISLQWDECSLTECM